MYAAILMLVANVFAACSEGKKTQAPLQADSGADKGRRVYFANCIACHNGDPKKDGTLGPAIAGASRALVEARVLRAEYPEGYTPKRDTKAMVALPHLAGSVDDLTAFLNQ